MVWGPSGGNAHCSERIRIGRNSPNTWSPAPSPEGGHQHSCAAPASFIDFPMHTLLRSNLRILALAACLSFAGCIGLEQTIELNPDLSGRAKIELSMTNPMGGMLAAMTNSMLKEVPARSACRIGQAHGERGGSEFRRKSHQRCQGRRYLGKGRMPINARSQSDFLRCRLLP